MTKKPKMNYLRENINEIQDSQALRGLGIVNALIVTLTCFFWIKEKVISYWIAKHTTGICWPYFDYCQSGHLFTSIGWQKFFYILLGLSLLSAILFIKKETVKWALVILLLVNIFKILIILIDYRLRLNQHIMSFWFLVAFLIIPKKKDVLLLLIALFYFAAGCLKLNYEWLSGSALYGQPWLVPESLIPLACVFVVILEMIFIWGIFSPNKLIRSSILILLVLFHISSFTVVGYYYPLLMFLMLSAFPLVWFLEDKKIVFSDLIKDFKVSLFLGVFLFTQFYSDLIYKNPDLTGHGRLLRLHMFDALTECKALAVFIRENATTFEQDVVISGLPVRIKCDPQVYRNWAIKKCDSIRFPKFTDFSIFLKTKRKTDKEYVQTLSIDHVCHGS